jgi:hypothetical protein
VSTSIKRLTLTRLLDDLAWQTKPGEHTVSVSACGHPARGGGICANCLDKELLRRGIDICNERYDRIDGRIRRAQP